MSPKVQTYFENIIAQIESAMRVRGLENPNLKLIQGFRNVNLQNEYLREGGSTISFGWHNIVRKDENTIKPDSRAIDFIWNNSSLGGYSSSNNNLEFWSIVGLTLVGTSPANFNVEWDQDLQAFRFVNLNPNSFAWGGAWYDNFEPLGVA